MSAPAFDPSASACPLCGSGRLRRFGAPASDGHAGSTVAVVECRACAFAWQWPLGRSATESVRHFQSAYRDGGAGTGYFGLEGKRAIAEVEMDFVATLPGRQRPGRLLDIGAGSGVFAEVAADRGWSVTAVDPALEADRLADDDRVTLLCGTTGDLPEDGARFDAVTLWDVIEHVPDPMALVADAVSRLAPGGHLVVETGNYKCAERVVWSPRYWQYQLDHRWYFSPASVERVMRAAGLVEPVLCRRMLRPDWQGEAAYGGPSRRFTLERILKRPWRVAAHLARHRDLVRARSWPLAGLPIFAMAARRPP